MSDLKLWGKAVRAYAYSASLVPVAIGGLYARVEGEAFSGVRFAVALVAGLLLHTAANLWNDYFDFKGGVDRKGGGEGSGVLVHGEMTPARCFRGASVCAALGATCGAWLAWQAGWGLLLLVAAGLVAALAYSAGPLSPKHRALGEAWVFLSMGVGMTLGGYAAQTGRFAWSAVAAGTPAAVLMTLILYVNNLRDLETDRKAGLRTLPMYFSPAEGKTLALFALAVPYGMVFLMSSIHRLPYSAMLSLLSVPLAARWGLALWREPVKERSVVGMAQLHMAFGVLFAAGLWIGSIIERSHP
jgi:1,4-dihydroxy-2-naphthoate polyprenyltransferase